MDREKDSYFETLLPLPIPSQIANPIKPSRMAIIKEQKMTSVGKDVEKLEPLCSAGRTAKCAAIMENSMGCRE